MTSNICDESKSTLAAEFYHKNRYTFDNCDNTCHVMTINAVNKNIKPKPDKIEVKIIFGNNNNNNNSVYFLSDRGIILYLLLYYYYFAQVCNGYTQYWHVLSDQ